MIRLHQIVYDLLHRLHPFRFPGVCSAEQKAVLCIAFHSLNQCFGYAVGNFGRLTALDAATAALGRKLFPAHNPFGKGIADGAAGIPTGLFMSMTSSSRALI